MLTLVLGLARGGVRRWHLRLAEALRAQGARPLVAWTEAGEPAPAGMDALFALERVLHPRPGPRPSERLPPDALPLAEFRAGERAHRAEGGVVWLALPGGGEPPSGTPAWRVLFDGAAGEAGLLAALLRSGAPLVEILGPDGAVLARGRPSFEAAGSLCERHETVTARLAPILAQALRAPQALAPEAPAAWAGRSLPAHAARGLARAVARRIYHLCFFAPHWRVGWRPAAGPSVWDGASLGGEPWRTIPDPAHRFFADPFPFRWRGETHLFVEDLDHRTGRGVISAMPFGADGPTGPMVPVLEEPFHLSYPFLLAHRGEVYMIPETSQNGTVSLYRADPFPRRWVRERDLLTGITASDATVVEFGGRWWMFASLHDGEGAHSDCLGLFSAPDLFGPWTPHPANPVLVDAGAARPGGAVVVRDGRLWRPAQDCTRLYGGGLALAEVTTLTDTAFAQSVRARLLPGPAWPGRRLHTLNRGGGIEVIDGSAAPLRARALLRQGGGVPRAVPAASLSGAGLG